MVKEKSSRINYMNKCVLEKNQKGSFVIFEINESDEVVNWFTKGDLNEYKKNNFSKERRKQVLKVINWMKIEYPELLI